MSEVGRSAIVIGAGIIGCTSAYLLSKAGIRVTVLERGQLGREASWASAGMIHEEITPSDAVNRFRRKSVSLFPELAREISALTGADSSYRMNGGFHLCDEENQLPEMRALYQAHQEDEIPCEWLDGSQIRAREPVLSPSIAGGIYFPNNGQIDPRQYVRTMAQAAMQLGARFRFGQPVIGFLRENERVTGAVTPEGEIRADATVLAAGAWSGHLAALLNVPLDVRPVRGQILKLETAPPLLKSTIHCGSLYLVARKDGSILAGSTVEHAGYDKRVTPEGAFALLQMIRRLAPGLSEATLADAWAGLRPHPGRDVPVIGPAPGWEGLFLATGHYRSGVIDSPLTGTLVAEWVAQGRTSFPLDAFAL